MPQAEWVARRTGIPYLAEQLPAAFNSLLDRVRHRGLLQTETPPPLGAQVLFGAIFGVMGLTFATPTCVVIATFVQMLYIEDVLGGKA